MKGEADSIPHRISQRKVFLSAGEASGDLHGSYLVRALRSFAPDMSISCLGGSLLRAAGAEVLVDNRDISVVGLFEVFRHLRSLYDSWKKIRAHLIRQKPDVVILIDFPDFNFLLARLARRLNIKVFYYISPQLWAWRSRRVYTLKRLVDAMAVILPFEKDFYDRYGMKVHYVGHPLLDVLGEENNRKAQGVRRKAPEVESAEYLKPDTPHNTPLLSPPCGSAPRAFRIGLLPGSRRSEIRFLLPLLLDTAQMLLDHDPHLSFLLPVAPTLEVRLIEELTSCRRLPLRIVSGDTYGVIRSCDLILTASGTVTLEAAILGTPMVVVYKVSDLSYYAGRRLIRVRHVGLPNLIAGSPIVPEILQNEARPERIAAEALALLKQPERLEQQRRALSLIRDQLGEPGVANRVARLVLNLISPEFPCDPSV